MVTREMMYGRNNKRATLVHALVVMLVLCFSREACSETTSGRAAFSKRFRNVSEAQKALGAIAMEGAGIPCNDDLTTPGNPPTKRSHTEGLTNSSGRGLVAGGLHARRLVFFKRAAAFLAASPGGRPRNASASIAGLARGGCIEHTRAAVRRGRVHLLFPGGFAHERGFGHFPCIL